MSVVSNLFDVAMVFALALMVALVSRYNMTEMFSKDNFTMVKNPGKENMEIITKSPCVLLKGNIFPNVCKPIPEKCKKCGACLRPGCPALTKKEDGTIAIDTTMCNGCGLCKNLCMFQAIETCAK
mgnify:CR=1 FL=1